MIPASPDDGASNTKVLNELTVAASKKATRFLGKSQHIDDVHVSLSDAPSLVGTQKYS